MPCKHYLDCLEAINEIRYAIELGTRADIATKDFVALTTIAEAVPYLKPLQYERLIGFYFREIGRAG